MRAGQELGGAVSAVVGAQARATRQETVVKVLAVDRHSFHQS